MNNQESITDANCSYIFSSEDYNIVSVTKELLWKIARSEMLSARQLEVIARALHVFEVLPSVIPDFEIQIQIVGPRRTFGTHEIYHWWNIGIEDCNVVVTSGGHFYRPATGGDAFSSMEWSASPEFATEYHDYLDSIAIVDDAQPFKSEIQSIDFSKPGYSLEVFENNEEIPGNNDNENQNTEDIVEVLELSTLDEVVRTLESAGVECVWENQVSLCAVDLQETCLTDPLYRIFEKISVLRTLDARNTDISDRTIVFIKHLESIEWLCLRNTAITDAGLRHLQALQNLQHLDLVGTSVFGPGLLYLRNLTNLRELNVSGFQHHDKWLEMLRSEMPQCSIYLN